MKKSIYILVLLAWCLLQTSLTFAQTPAGRLASMQVSIWPDFDDPSVLVLLTGELPADLELPVEVSIPVPDDAQINAVAFIDDPGMVSLDYEEADGMITFTATAPSFRVEYYAPYVENGLSRSYNFAWFSDLDIEEFAVEIQQPANASTLTSDPEAVEVFTNQVDGLIYHSLGSQSLPNRVPYNASISYEMVSDMLTSSLASDPATSLEEQAIPPGTVEAQTNWALIAGVLGLIAVSIAGTWFALTRNSGSKKSSRPKKPSPKRMAQPETVFCHNCGAPASSSDRFCRSCGTELKRL